MRTPCGIKFCSKTSCQQCLVASNKSRTNLGDTVKTTKPSKEGIGGGGDSIFQGYLSGREGGMPCEFGIGPMEREGDRQTDRHKRQMTALIPPFPPTLGVLSFLGARFPLFSRVFRSSLSKLTVHTPKFRTKSGKEIKSLSCRKKKCGR